MKIYAEENGEVNAYKRQANRMKLSLKIMDDKLKRRDATIELLQAELEHVATELAFYEDDDSNVVILAEYQDE